MHGHKDERTRDELVALGYERDDIGLRTIAFWVFWFFVFAIMAAVATAGIYQVLVPGGVAPAVVEKRDRYPAEPRIQDEVSVKTDIYDLRKAEEKELAASGPSPYAKGGYRIPVDEAIKLWSARNGGGHVVIEKLSSGGSDEEPMAHPDPKVPHEESPATTGSVGHAPEPGGSH